MVAQILAKQTKGNVGVTGHDRYRGIWDQKMASEWRTETSELMSRHHPHPPPRVHTHTCTQLHTRTHVCVHIHTCTHTHRYTHAHRSKHTHTQAEPHTHTRSYTHTRAYTWPPVPLVLPSVTFNMTHQSHPVLINTTQGPRMLWADALARPPLAIPEPNTSRGKKSLRRRQFSQPRCSLP